MLTVLTVCRNDKPILNEVAFALGRQGVQILWHVSPQPYSPRQRYAWRNICRGRNELRLKPETPYCLWLDSDVVLPPDACRRMIDALNADLNLGATGANYGDRDETGAHVGMGALMVRSWLAKRFKFRAGRGRCECRNFAEDVRSLGFRVEYLPGLFATHLPKGDNEISRPSQSIWAQSAMKFRGLGWGE